MSRDKTNILPAVGKPPGARLCPLSPTCHQSKWTLGKEAVCTVTPLVPAPGVCRRRAASFFLPVPFFLSICVQVATHFYIPLQKNVKRDSCGKGPETLTSVSANKRSHVGKQKASVRSLARGCETCKPSTDAFAAGSASNTHGPTVDRSHLGARSTRT